MKKVSLATAALVMGAMAFGQNNGKVGINTTNPQTVLHIDGKKDNTATGVPTALQIANDIVVDTLGRLGIGTINPKVKADIVGGIYLHSPLGTSSDDGAIMYTPDIGRIWLGNLNGTVGGTAQYPHKGDAAISISGKSSFPIGSPEEFYNGGIVLVTNNGVSSLNNYFILNKNGNVGIGTTNPQAKLHIEAGNTPATIGTGFKLVDGSQGAGKTLTSDSNGNAKWVASSFAADVNTEIQTGGGITATLSATTLPAYQQFGTPISLSPGIYRVDYIINAQNTSTTSRSEMFFYLSTSNATPAGPAYADQSENFLVNEYKQVRRQLPFVVTTTTTFYLILRIAYNHNPDINISHAAARVVKLY